MAANIHLSQVENWKHKRKSAIVQSKNQAWLFIFKYTFPQTQKHSNEPKTSTTTHFSELLKIAVEYKSDVLKLLQWRNQLRKF